MKALITVCLLMLLITASQAQNYEPGLTIEIPLPHHKMYEVPSASFFDRLSVECRQWRHGRANCRGTVSVMRTLAWFLAKDAAELEQLTPWLDNPVAPARPARVERAAKLIERVEKRRHTLAQGVRDLIKRFPGLQKALIERRA